MALGLNIIVGALTVLPVFYLGRRLRDDATGDVSPHRIQARDRIRLDPGIGFGKTAQHNLALTANLGRLAATNDALREVVLASLDDIDEPLAAAVTARLRRLRR